MAIEFGTWEAPSSINPYVDTVAQLAQLNNEAASVTIIVSKKDAGKTKLNFSKAANAIDKTARVRVNGETVIKDGIDTGEVRFVFTLSPRHKARKGSGHETTPEATTETAEADAATETATATVSAPKPGKR